MTIRLLYFGVLKDFFEAERDVVELPAGSSVEDLLIQLKAQAASDLPIWKAMAVAVNRDYAELATPLHDGDEVALLPPVSGGRDAH